MLRTKKYLENDIRITMHLLAVNVLRVKSSSLTGLSQDYTYTTTFQVPTFFFSY